jgi:hypothetical protein
MTNQKNRFLYVEKLAIEDTLSDPDGHYLEFIGILPGKTRGNDEKRILTYDQWLEIQD